MNDLLAFAFEAHGGLPRWDEFETLFRCGTIYVHHTIALSH